MSGNSKGEPNAKGPSDFDRFSDFVRRLMAVPHSEVKAAMEAHKKNRVASVSRDSGASSRER